MKISTSKQMSHNFIPREVGSVKELAEIITNTNWSSGIYQDGHRNTQNFEKAYTLAFDIDDGLSIEEAKERVKDYKHIIAPSKNHRKDKKGQGVADRYRVVLFLENEIDNAKDYRTTWENAVKLFPETDQQCKDAARLWHPCNGVECYSEEGKEISIKKWVKPEKIHEGKTLEIKGKLSSKTNEFLLFGQRVSGWNTKLTSAVIDIREQGYSEQECTTLVTEITDSIEDGDIRCITSIYNRDEMRYPPRVEASAFNFKTINDVFNNTEKLTWTVEDLLIDSGLSILAANPKAGKSTISRQLAKSVARGEEFFGRKCTQGRVLYLALEEHEGMLKLQFKKLGVDSTDDILMHVGPLNSIENKYTELENAIQKLNPTLTVIDTMHLFTGIKELNSYAEVNIELSKLRKIARNNNTHILTLHHSKKSGGTGGTSLLGSSAIAGAVDCIIEIERHDNRRKISTNLRGGKAWYNVPLEFDKATETYTLGDEDDNF